MIETWHSCLKPKLGSKDTRPPTPVGKVDCLDRRSTAWTSESCNPKVRCGRHISFYQVSCLKNQLSFFHVRSFLLYVGQAFPPGRFYFDGTVFLVIFLLFVILLRWVESWWNPQQEELLETETQVSGPAKSKDETKELAEMPKSLAKSLDNVCSHYP